MLAILNDWRSRSTNLFIDIGNTEEADVPKLAEKLVVFLIGFFSTSALSQRSRFRVSTLAIMRDAIEIISIAANIDGNLRKSKAEYTVFFGNIPPAHQSKYFGYVFDPTRMDHGSGGPKVTDNLPTVELVVAPGLRKTGNDNGENYQEEWVLVKAEVLCNMTKILNFSEEDED